MGLMGDSSDNIPGVPGIGEKTAQALIKEYGTIENLLSRVNEITRPKLRQTLIDNADLGAIQPRICGSACRCPDRIEYDALRVTRAG